MLRLLPCLALLLLLGACATAPRQTAIIPVGTTAQLTVLETTDLHSHLLGYDYYRLEADPGFGLERTATLIGEARARYPNTLLLDAGDTIQGTALADYQALVDPVSCEQELAVYKAMDAVAYDAATIGNHGFNYGLPFLRQVTGNKPDNCHGPSFPLVLANVFDAESGKTLYPPWVILERRIEATTAAGEPIEAAIRIGVIGLTPPRIMDWDSRHLEGRVTVAGTIETLRKQVPRMRAAGAELVLVLVHGGLSRAPYTPEMDNSAWYLAAVPGIDALLMGHSHREFPGPSYADLPEVDSKRGLVRGVPAVMAGYFGADLGVIHLPLVYRDGGWHSDPNAAHSEIVPICGEDDQCVAPDPAIRPLVADAHEATIAYVKTAIGASDFRMASYFSDLGENSALVAVQAAQRDYVEAWIEDKRPELAELPVLSAAAAFRTGFYGADDYTDVAAGSLTIRNAADLYYYPNTIAAVLIDGRGLRAWLEHAALRFNRIDPDASQPQPLINPRFPGYNFDQIAGIAYTIDLSKPASQRIVSLRFHGAEVRPQQRFVVATNNYRAQGGGEFPGLDGSNVVLDGTVANRSILIDWIRAHGKLHRSDFGARPWRFAPMATKAPVTFTSAAGKLAFAGKAGLQGVRLLRDLGDGTAVYALDLNATTRRDGDSR